MSLYLIVGAEMDMSNSGEFLVSFRALSICVGQPWDSLFQPIRWRLFPCQKKSWITLLTGTFQSKRLSIVKNTADDWKQVMFVGQTFSMMVKLWHYTWNIYLKTLFLHNYFENVASVLQSTETSVISSIKINISKILQGSAHTFFLSEQYEEVNNFLLRHHGFM